ncbi:hypothetical protein CBA19CS22_39665 [Caballeronia novacaledonica]|uniref:Uncharacterized protein n=1 Tax=Caballeronia novacaledonica TaxID=1544861 RepID=A0ACB5R6G0_9BURK|nr:hypothetical protein CBA19CS22_39665 [Caballeronia novacaledonica]
MTNGQITIERAQEGTSAINAPAGTCALFVWTEQNLTDFIEQGYGGHTGCGCKVVAGSDRLTATQTDCTVTVERPSAADVTWRAGSNQYTQGENGDITAKPVGD